MSSRLAPAYPSRPNCRIASSTRVDRRSSPPVLGTALVPDLRRARASDRARALPPPEPVGAGGTHERRRLAALGAVQRLPPRGSLLMEELRDGLGHPPGQVLVRLPLLWPERLAVANGDGRPPGARPEPTLRHRLERTDDRDRS